MIRLIPIQLIYEKGQIVTLGFRQTDGRQIHRLRLNPLLAQSKSFPLRGPDRSSQVQDTASPTIYPCVLVHMTHVTGLFVLFLTLIGVDV